MQPVKIQSKLQILLAKPFEKINNSRFCTKEVSEIYNLIYEIKDGDKIDIPKIYHILSYKQTNSSKNDSYLSFDYINKWNNNETFFSFKNAIHNLQNGSNLILIGYQLLTQFNIGLLQIIKNSFEEIIFEKNETIGCVIILKNYVENFLVLNQLNDLSKFMFTDNNQIILSIISILDVYGNNI